MPPKTDRLPQNWAVALWDFSRFRAGFRYRFLPPTGSGRALYRVLPDLGAPDHEGLSSKCFEQCFLVLESLEEMPDHMLFRFLDQHMAEALKPHRCSTRLALKRWMNDMAELLRIIEPDIILPVYAKRSEHLCRKLLATATDVVARSKK